ncbi:MAG: hypothetical protein RL318_685 [Fibrobacterota bacterium]|jgi:hypothetical protein
MTLRQGILLTLPLSMAGCGSGSFLDSTDPWIDARWLSTSGQNLSKASIGTLSIRAGAWGGGKATAILLLDDEGSQYTPGTVALDQFGTGQTTLVVSGKSCPSGTQGTPFDSMTVRLEVAGTTQATTRLAVACQSALREGL